LSLVIDRPIKGTGVFKDHLLSDRIGKAEVQFMKTNLNVVKDELTKMLNNQFKANFHAQKDSSPNSPEVREENAPSRGPKK
jgi:hypothetical protein